VATSRILLEKEILEKLKGTRGICELLDYHQDQDFIYFILEYLEMDLFEFLQSVSLSSPSSSTSILTENEAAEIFYQICCAVQKIHSNNYVHHDLKLDNIMINKSGNWKNNNNNNNTTNLEIKIIDFGLSAKVSGKKGEKIKSFSGTKMYAAPELFCGIPYEPKATDIYSLGVILFALLTTAFPFSRHSKKFKKEKTDVTYINNVCDQMNNVSQEAKNLVRFMLDPQPEFRLEIDEILQHPFFEKILPK